MIFASTWCNFFQNNDNSSNKSVCDKNVLSWSSPSFWENLLFSTLLCAWICCHLLHSRSCRSIWKSPLTSLRHNQGILHTCWFACSLWAQISSSVIFLSTQITDFGKSSSHKLCFILTSSTSSIYCQSFGNLHYVLAILTRRPWKNNYNPTKRNKDKRLANS